MITCRELVELLLDFIAGELLPECRNAAEQHLKDCPQCLAYLEGYHRIVQLSRHLPAEPMPPHLVRRLQTMLQENCNDQLSGNREGTVIDM